MLCTDDFIIPLCSYCIYFHPDNTNPYFSLRLFDKSLWLYLVDGAASWTLKKFIHLNTTYFRMEAIHGGVFHI